MALNYAGLSPVFQQAINYGRTNPIGGATAYNLGSGDNLSSLSELINSITRQGQSAALNARIPNAAGLEAASSANIGSELSGELPADVLTNLRQAAAERGVATGSPASPNSNAAYLRALGLTSLDLTRMGQQELTAAEGRNPAAPVFDPTSQLLTPYQAGTLGLEEQRQQNELLLSRQRLAQQAALGGRGGGGQPEAPADAYVRQTPFGYGIPESVSLSPYASSSASSAGDPTAAWLQSIGYGPGRVPYTSTGTGGGGRITIGPTVDEQLQRMYEEMFPGAAPADTGGDQSGGPEGQ